ncbi:MAG: hypothetical protein HQM10_26410 [Candidatus Riflebacteria bacterium]|nr:hypothetical protein [Candidatus Riflebacteria bacterium]
MARDKRFIGKISFGTKGFGGAFEGWDVYCGFCFQTRVLTTNRCNGRGAAPISSVLAVGKAEIEQSASEYYKAHVPLQTFGYNIYISDYLSIEFE